MSAEVIYLRALKEGIPLSDLRARSANGKEEHFEDRCEFSGEFEVLLSSTGVGVRPLAGISSQSTVPVAQPLSKMRLKSLSLSTGDGNPNMLLKSSVQLMYCLGLALPADFPVMTVPRMNRPAVQALRLLFTLHRKVQPPH